MKKQQQKTVHPHSMPDMVQNHKMREVSPPESARKDIMQVAKSKAETLSKAAQEWMKAAKSQSPSAGFLEVPSEGLKPTEGLDREMLYKGKKK